MPQQVLFTQATLAELFNQVAYSKSLKFADQQGLLAARLEHSLSEDDRNSVERLLYGIRRGWLKIVDEI